MCGVKVCRRSMAARSAEPASGKEGVGPRGQVGESLSSSVTNTNSGGGQLALLAPTRSRLLGCRSGPDLCRTGSRSLLDGLIR